MSATIQLRGGTYAVENAANPVLAEREVVLELDSGRIKVGDGATAYRDLEYFGLAYLTSLFDGRYAPIGVWFTRYATVDRPDAGTVDTSTARGTYFDTTLGKPAWSDGTDWVDATGTAI